LRYSKTKRKKKRNQKYNNNFLFRAIWHKLDKLTATVFWVGKEAVAAGLTECGNSSIKQLNEIKNQ
jgi:hypothetical protein